MGKFVSEENLDLLLEELQSKYLSFDLLDKYIENYVIPKVYPIGCRVVLDPTDMTVHPAKLFPGTYWKVDDTGLWTRVPEDTVITCPNCNTAYPIVFGSCPNCEHETGRP